MDEIRIEERGKIRVVVFDDPARSVNTMTPDLLEAFQEKVVPLLDDSGVHGLVFFSGKPDTFIAGADIRLFAQADDPDLVSEIDGAYSRILTRIHRGDKPVVAAVHGAALGGGLEIALGCHCIVASDHPATVMGLPEVQLGILPAAGGTQRLPARVGLFRGLDLLLTGRRVRVRRALQWGLVDEVVQKKDLLTTAVARAEALIRGDLERPRKAWSLKERALALPGLRKIVFRRARRAVLAKTRGNLPGPFEILKCVELGLSAGEDAALEQEIRLIGPLLMTPQSRALVEIFLTVQDMKGDSRKADRIHRVGIVGGGLMGAGIASVTLGKARVTVLDVSEDALERCRDRVRKGLDKQLASGALAKADADERWARFETTLDPDGLAGADLVIEAVNEDLELKQQVLALAEARMSPEGVFASNTSSIPIASIAANARRPERVVGLHYFSPVPRTGLVELVAQDKAAPEALDAARAFAASQGKTVIQVRDRPGFYTTRILWVYLNEAVRLVEAGTAVGVVDRAMKDFGFPEGPLALMDEVGLDVCAHTLSFLGEALGLRRALRAGALNDLVAADRLGRKNGRGWYRYGGKGKKRPCPEAAALARRGPPGNPDAAKIQDRLSLVLMNEAVRSLEEGVIASPRDGDVGAVLGLGFPPFRGGPFHHADHLGANAAKERLEDLAKTHGDLYRPADLLQDMARTGGRFFEAREASKGQARQDI